MRIHFDLVWTMFMIGVLYDRNLKTLFINIGFLMVGIRVRKKQK